MRFINVKSGIQVSLRGSKKKEIGEKNKRMGGRVTGFQSGSVSLGTAACRLYLTNQSASGASCRTFNFSLSKYNLTHHNL